MKYFTTIIVVLACVFLASVMFTAKAEAPKARWFLVGYAGVNNKQESIAGGDGFTFVNSSPNVYYLQEELTQSHNLTKVFITSLFEFRTKAEYDAFWKQPKQQ